MNKETSGVQELVPRSLVMIAILAIALAGILVALSSSSTPTAEACGGPCPPTTCEEANALGLIGEPDNARKVTLCHFTGSDSNPVVINEVALASATSHDEHHGDLWNCGAIADTLDAAFCSSGVGYPSP